ncbi:MAG: cupin domain-containing protein [Rhodopirellula sp.]|nr:cupin domain-containing protein [Rhodopirellula sp.]
MAMNHAVPGEVVDVKPFGSSLTTTKTSTLFKTEQIEVIRIVMHNGKVIPEHKAPGAIIVQCLEGRVAFTALGKTEELCAGQLLYLEAEEPHALHCLEDASILVTILSS